MTGKEGALTQCPAILPYSFSLVGLGPLYGGQEREQLFSKDMGGKILNITLR